MALGWRIVAVKCRDLQGHFFSLHSFNFFFNFVSTQRTMWRLIWTCVVGRCTLIVRNEILLRRIIHKNLWTYRDRNPPYSRERTMYSLLLWFKKKKSIILIISLQRESVASNCKPRHIILTTHKINFQIIKKKKNNSRNKSSVFIFSCTTSQHPYTQPVQRSRCIFRTGRAAGTVSNTQPRG